MCDVINGQQSDNFPEVQSKPLNVITLRTIIFIALTDEFHLVILNKWKP